jgi:hypothetical protein
MSDPVSALLLRLGLDPFGFVVALALTVIGGALAFAAADALAGARR